MMKKLACILGLSVATTLLASFTALPAASNADVDEPHFSADGKLIKPSN
jgi:hypothetical protein